MKGTPYYSCRALVPMLLICTLAIAQPPDKPLPPSDDWKGTNFVTAQSASVAARGDPFDPSLHGAMTPQGEICSNELNRAIYRQDVLHAFESKAHFDNCAFEDSSNYVDELVAEARKQLSRIPVNAAAGGDVPAEARAAMHAFGRALHGIQDFYAHTNYVELVQERSPNLASESAILLVEFWKPAGREYLRKLVADGLHSGRVAWSLPHTCAASVPSHGQLAKDSPKTPAGTKPSIFRNSLTGQSISNHNVAFNLASRATREFLRWAGESHPQLEKFCGQTVKYIVQQDRRKTD